MLLFVFFGESLVAYTLLQLGGLSLLIILGISYKIARGGLKTGYYVLISYFVLFLGILLYTLKDFDVLPFNIFTKYTLTLGVAIQAILLSVALANSINTLRKEKEEANQRVLDEVKKNEELVLNQNITLEKKVIERTEELQRALDDLKAAQSQIVQSEKMASLGTLTAGIAHEINNPINFVSANVMPLRDNITDITNLIKEYKSIDFRNLKSELVRLSKLEEELELDYMLNETKELIDGIEEGANRTHTIVEGLTTFSRGDGGTKTKANINKGIKSTVSVLKSRLNDVNLSLDLEKELPTVVCEIGKINQVVLNLLNNALDALEEKNGPNSPKSELLVKSWHTKEFVMIRVKDNADGMNSEVQKKVMEPFYTTKPVGKGTGLGLSISYSIIEEHNGDMILESEVGSGTSFTFMLPLN